MIDDASSWERPCNTWVPPGPEDSTSGCGDCGWPFSRHQEGKNAAAVALGSLGGKSKSKAKQIASAENGKKGGRPKKKLQ